MEVTSSIEMELTSGTLHQTKQNKTTQNKTKQNKKTNYKDILRWILNYLRDPTCLVPLKDMQVLEELLIEAKYFHIFRNNSFVFSLLFSSLLFSSLILAVIAPLVQTIEQKIEKWSKHLLVFYILKTFKKTNTKRKNFQIIIISVLID